MMDRMDGWMDRWMDGPNGEWGVVCLGVTWKHEGA